MFRDCKTGGYNLEKTQVNERRLLAVVLLIAIAYTLARFRGQLLQNLKVSEYICRPKERVRKVERNSCFTIGLQAQVWVQCLEIWSDLVSRLLALKPHKRLHFHKEVKAISLMQSSLYPCFHPLRSKDYELYSEVSEAMIYGSLIRLMVRQLAA